MRLIDADAVIVVIGGGYIDIDAESFMNAPSIDIVHCGECKYRQTCCRPCYKADDSYCSDGEREGE